ncbi:hypothetical protein BJ878DRAFT_545099 [Calycina marina]|uniref:Uncharacterized protein n=1 Tax=Calycina marina TaxID=1763456 RepID=A0A9P7YXJ5_9HELO|nr:hypothetical protein BJ878DRAFT_545099 [Calycina marina]
MPNWKTYEASTRLLSAIIAAHPGLKLNYDEIARYLGGGFNKKSVWSRFTQLNRHAACVKEIVDNSRGDPFPLLFDDRNYAKVHTESEVEEIVRYYGENDLNKKGIQNAMFRVYNPIIAELKAAADGPGINISFS